MTEAKGIPADKGEIFLDVILEVTEGAHYPNHTYLIAKGRGWLLGYRNAVTGAVKIYKTPLKQFSRTKRKFKKISDPELFNAYAGA